MTRGRDHERSPGHALDPVLGRSSVLVEPNLIEAPRTLAFHLVAVDLISSAPDDIGWVPDHMVTCTVLRGECFAGRIGGWGGGDVEVFPGGASENWNAFT